MEQMNIGGRDYPITGTVEHKVFGAVPIVGIPLMSDYEWHVSCLKSRLEDPELYRRVLGEDVDAVIDQLKATIAEYEKAVGREASA